MEESEDWAYHFVMGFPEEQSDQESWPSVALRWLILEEVSLYQSSVSRAIKEK